MLVKIATIERFVSQAGVILLTLAHVISISIKDINKKWK